MSLYYQLREFLRQNRDKPLMDVLSIWEPAPKDEKLAALVDENSSKVPGEISCLITGCSHVMKPEDVMAHYITAHRQLKIERVFDDTASPPLGIEVDFNHMKNNHVYCLKLLSFGGRKQKKNLPILACRKLENKSLPSGFQHLAYDLPILIMATRTIVGLPLKPEHKGMRHGQNRLVIWPVTIETKSSAYDLRCRILSLQPTFMAYKRTQVGMRSFEDSEWAGKLLMLDPETFSMTEMEMDRLNVRMEDLVIGVKFRIKANKSIESKNAKPEKVSDDDDESGKTFTLD